MGYEMKLIRNVSRAEPHKLGLALVAGCFLFSMAFLSVPKLVGFRQMMNPVQYILVAEGSKKSSELTGIQTTVESSTLKNSLTSFTASNSQDGADFNLTDLSNEKAMPGTKPLCDFSDRRSDVCKMEGDIRILCNSSSIVFLNHSLSVASHREETWLIKPHARKGDSIALHLVSEISVKALSKDYDDSFQCTVNHSVPAVVFSTGGYMGNIFHDFTDVLIPLFITSYHYQGQVQFLISETHSWWLSKYRPLLKELSHHEIIDFSNEKRVHCYPHATIGLTSHKEMTIDPSRSPNRYSMLNFTHLLRKSYSLERQTATELLEATQAKKKPRLLIIARKWTRSFRNVNEIVELAEALGYEIVVAEADVSSNLANYSRIVNSCDVMMGVHGAGLTNLVFLPMNAVVIQVVPLGGLEKIAWADFGGPSLDMKLKYLQYSITEDESTLIDMYPRDHPVFKDPVSIHRQGWMALRGVYLDKQSVRLDVARFKGYLEQALQLLR